MFLTRLGMNAKMIITGDVTQVDLMPSQTSGLVHAMRLLGNIPGIAQIEFGKEDIVRHKLVQRIVEAYEKERNKGNANGNNNNNNNNTYNTYI